eukprot:14839075-Alexandrium_andersonii.AAC.1
MRARRPRPCVAPPAVRVRLRRPLAAPPARPRVLIVLRALRPRPRPAPAGRLPRTAHAARP